MSTSDRLRLWAVALAAAASTLVPTRASADRGLHVDRERTQVRVSAVAHPERFQGFLPQWFGMPGYHLLVWEKGASARNALFVTPVSDRSLLGALLELGLQPGPDLPMAAWEARRDSSSPAPDSRAEGPKVAIAVTWEGVEAPISIREILKDSGGKGFDFRLVGNASNIPRWKSGCGICLYSCPGAKIANASYTIRDYITGSNRFRTTERMPPAGTSVTLILTPEPHTFE